jgi:hypothetical protein
MTGVLEYWSTGDGRLATGELAITWNLEWASGNTCFEGPPQKGGEWSSRFQFFKIYAVIVIV